MKLTRRDFLQLAGYAGVVLSSGLPGVARATAEAKREEFYFVQFSDTHWGFDKAKVNPDHRGTLRKAVATVNALDHKPDFVVFTGDLTHTTDDPKLRRARMAEFRDIVGELQVRDLRFLPGEHDASLDNGEAYQEFFGHLHYTFDHKGVHFIALDNVSDPRGRLGEAQLRWLAADLAQLDPATPVVVLAHRPLFDLHAEWGWTTGDGAEAVRLLSAHPDVTVFYGHIHQSHEHRTGHIVHHAARSLIFPLPAPGSTPKRKPLPWDPATPYRGLGVRDIEVGSGPGHYALTDIPVRKG